MSNFYDLLGVDRAAATDEIRAAWKAAVADLDPTDPIFRAYSSAAEVLLDDERRAAYDAELAPVEEPEEEPEPAPGTDPSTQATLAAPVVLTKGESRDAGVDAPATAAVTAPSGEPAAEPAGAAGGATGVTPPAGWVLGAVATAAVLALVLAVFLLAQPGGGLFGDDSPREVAERNADVEQAVIAAEGAAERMVPDLLSYDYRTLDQDAERRNALLTENQLEETERLWADLTPDVVANELQVVTTSEAAGLTRMSEDTLTAVVVVFFRQDIVSKGAAPKQDSRWATFNLVREDADATEWLVDDVCVDSGCE